MKNILLFLMLLISSKVFSQDSINYFKGDFDSALKKAKQTNKNIFFITRSESCPYFFSFKENITKDYETIKFLNDEFIVFEFDMDKASEEQTKRLKKYYHSWRGFPQIYFIDINEKLISDIVYSIEFNKSHQENLNVWKNYKKIESDWKTIKHQKRNNLTLENLKKFLLYREIKYSSFSFFQKINTIKKYFKSIDKKKYSDTKNWLIFEDYITHRDYPELFDYVAQNKKELQDKNGAERISNYLTKNYIEIISWKSTEDRKTLAEEYPFNTITEAKEALKNYKVIEPSFKLPIKE